MQAAIGSLPSGRSGSLSGVILFLVALVKGLCGRPVAAHAARTTRTERDKAHPVSVG